MITPVYVRQEKTYTSLLNIMATLHYNKIILSLLAWIDKKSRLKDTYQYLHIAEVMRPTSTSNYVIPRIPIKLILNLDAWEKHLKEYADKKLQYPKQSRPSISQQREGQFWHLWISHP